PRDPHLSVAAERGRARPRAADEGGAANARPRPRRRASGVVRRHGRAALMSAVLDAARGYAARGWAVTPTQGKKPILPRWQEQHLLSGVELVGHFADGVNVGIVNGTLSGGRVRGGLVDGALDARETLAVADVFLPATGLVFGRPSKPRSHRIYIGDPLPTTVQFKDVDNPKTTLVELRSTAPQTVWPPSTHPEGEAIPFDAQGEPTRIAGATLRTAVALLAS